MATSFYDLSVGSYLQTLTALSGFLEKGLAHCKEHKIDPNVIADTRLYPNMLPFRFQILAVANHSIGTVEALKKGLLVPPTSIPPLDYAGLQKVVSDTIAALAALKPDEVNALEHSDVVFQSGELKLPFTGANFVMSFSLPNFYFHATTAYNILRSVGVPLGKRDFIGMPRMKH